MVAKWDDRLSSFTVVSNEDPETSKVVTPEPEQFTATNQLPEQEPLDFGKPELSNSFVGPEGLVEEEANFYASDGPVAEQIDVPEIVTSKEELEQKMASGNFENSMADVKQATESGMVATNVADYQTSIGMDAEKIKEEANKANDELEKATDGIKEGIAGAFGFKTDDNKEKEKENSLPSLVMIPIAGAFASTLAASAENAGPAVVSGHSVGAEDMAATFTNMSLFASVIDRDPGMSNIDTKTNIDANHISGPRSTPASGMQKVRDLEGPGGPGDWA